MVYCVYTKVKTDRDTQRYTYPCGGRQTPRPIKYSLRFLFWF